MKPPEFIALIRESFVGAEYVYTNGSCLKFHQILKAVFPSAEAYYSDPRCDHVVTKIDGHFYDITGIVSGEESSVYDGQCDHAICDLFMTGVDCPRCDEPVVIGYAIEPVELPEFIRESAHE